MLKGARPIKDTLVSKTYDSFKHSPLCTIDNYKDLWFKWITSSKLKQIKGLEKFKYSNYSQGTSQSFDNFFIRHSSSKTLTCLIGDFQYHSCLGKHTNFSYFNLSHQPTNCALIISLPFSDYGKTHPNFYEVLEYCNKFDIPVCLDLAYWGISSNISIDLDQYKCVKEVTCSLSKPFYTLENHRIGIRFSREYLDDGISMIDEVKMYNKHSIELGCLFLSTFDCDFIYNKYKVAQLSICADNNLIPTDCVIFGIGGDEYNQYNRGIDGNNRVCISDLLNETQY